MIFYSYNTTLMHQVGVKSNFLLYFLFSFSFFVSFKIENWSKGIKIFIFPPTKFSLSPTSVRNSRRRSFARLLPFPALPYHRSVSSVRNRLPPLSPARSLTVVTDPLGNRPPSTGPYFTGVLSSTDLAAGSVSGDVKKRYSPSLPLSPAGSVRMVFSLNTVVIHPHMVYFCVACCLFMTVDGQIHLHTCTPHSVFLFLFFFLWSSAARCGNFQWLSLVSS
jgi:hypothetical protein